MTSHLSHACTAAFLAILLGGAPAALLAQAPGKTRAAQQTVSGADLYQNYCASCHGKDAKGGGALASELRTRPTDLTLLAKKNGGRFPADAVRKEIDGKNPAVRSHGGPDMPVWGDVFTQVRDYTPLQEKLNALVKHLEGVQVK